MCCFVRVLSILYFFFFFFLQQIFHCRSVFLRLCTTHKYTNLSLNRQIIFVKPTENIGYCVCFVTLSYNFRKIIKLYDYLDIEKRNVHHTRRLPHLALSRRWRGGRVGSQAFCIATSQLSRYRQRYHQLSVSASSRVWIENR